MGICVTETYPKVVPTRSRQTLYFRLEGDLPADGAEVKIQPMERYGEGHAPNYTSHDPSRYAWTPLSCVEGDLYAATVDFASEQRYSVRVRMGEESVYYGYAYAVDADLAALRPYKGDTHLHTNRSDGCDEPFPMACLYRAAGYDFIAVTDHGRFYPSDELQTEMAALTDAFYVMHGEEVHPKGGSYFHIICLDADRHVTAVFEQRPEEAKAGIQHVLDTRPDIHTLPDPYAAAMRIFITSEIRAAGGVAVMAHPFWESGDEYNMQTVEFFHHWRHGDFDALEVLAGCDNTGNGNNLQELLWHDLRAEGLRVPVVGSSDCHIARCLSDWDHFTCQFSIVFAADHADLASAIAAGRSVAVDRQNDKHFRCVGDYRLAKYARFLMAEYYPPYTALCAAHAEALSARDEAALTATEASIAAWQEKFYAL